MLTRTIETAPRPMSQARPSERHRERPQNGSRARRPARTTSAVTPSSEANRATSRTSAAPSLATGFARASGAPGRGRAASGAASGGGPGSGEGAVREGGDERHGRGSRRRCRVRRRAAPASRLSSSRHVRRSCPNVGSSRTRSAGAVGQGGRHRQAPLLAARQRERVRGCQVRRVAGAPGARRPVDPAARRSGRCRRGPSSSSSRTIRARNWCSGSWKTRADVADELARRPAREWLEAVAGHSASPATTTSDPRREQSGEDQRQGRLSAPVRPDDRQRLRGSQLRSTAETRRRPSPG